LLGYLALSGALINLASISWAVFTEQDISGFVYVTLVAGIISQMQQVFVSIWALHRNGIEIRHKHSFSGFFDKFPGIFTYVWTTNISSTIRMLSREADELIIAALSSPEIVGLFKIAKQFSRILPILLDPLYQTIYPELSRLSAIGSKRGFISLIKRTTLLVSITALSVWFGFILLGKYLIVITVGLAYSNVFLTTVIYMFALVIAICGFALQPAMLALGFPKVSFNILVISTLLYFVILVLAMNKLGLVGASTSYVGYYAVWSIAMFVQLRRRVDILP